MTNNNKLSLRSTGIIVAAAAIFAFFMGLVIAGALNLTQHASSQEKIAPIPLVTEEGTSPFVSVASAVMPSVVNVSTSRMVKTQVPSMQLEGPFRDFFKEFLGPQGSEQKVTSLGSGVIFDERGYIITNNHVISGATDIVVKLPDKTEYRNKKVKVVGKDPATDIAVLKIEDNRKFPAARLGNSDDIKIGDWAIAIGNSFGFENSVTVGVISAKGRSGINTGEGAPRYQDFIQTDASINPGNSGGPLINIRGEVIGINTVIASRSGGSEGIGFAVPVTMAKNVADQLVAKGKVSRGYLGVNIQPVSEDMKDALNLKSTDGALVADVNDGTPAAAAGLKAQDVITTFDGKPVKSSSELSSIVAQTPVGKDVTMEVVRDGKTINLRAKLTEYPEEETVAALSETGPWLGLRVENLTADDKSALGIKKGVGVSEVAPNSPADNAGIQSGDVIIKIQNRDVSDLSGYNRIKSDLRDNKKPIPFQLRRDQMTLIVAVRPE